MTLLSLSRTGELTYLNFATSSRKCPALDLYKWYLERCGWWWSLIATVKEDDGQRWPRTIQKQQGNIKELNSRTLACRNCVKKHGNFTQMSNHAWYNSPYDVCLFVSRLRQTSRAALSVYLAISLTKEGQNWLLFLQYAMLTLSLLGWNEILPSIAVCSLRHWLVTTTRAISKALYHQQKYLLSTYRTMGKNKPRVRLSKSPVRSVRKVSHDTQPTKRSTQDPKKAEPQLTVTQKSPVAKEGSDKPDDDNEDASQILSSSDEEAGLPWPDSHVHLVSGSENAVALFSKL